MIPRIFSVLVVVMASVLVAGAAGVQDSAREFVRRAQAALGPGWEVTLDEKENFITVCSKEKFLSVSIGSNGPPEGEVVKACEFHLAFKPLVTPEEYGRIAEENERARVKADELHFGWAQRIWIEGYDDLFEPEWPEELKDKIKEFRALQKTMRRLPDRWFELGSVDAYEPTFGPIDEQERERTEEAYKRVTGMLSSYPAPGRHEGRYGPRQAVDDLVERIRAELPGGWKAEYGQLFPGDDGQDGMINIRRTEEIRANSHKNPGETAEPGRTIYEFHFEVLAWMPEETHRRKSGENAYFRKEVEKVAARLREAGLEESYGKFWHAQTSQQQAEATRYEQLRRAVQKLPQYSYGGISLREWRMTEEPAPEPADPEVAKECREVREKVAGLLTKYPEE